MNTQPLVTVGDYAPCFVSWVLVFEPPDGLPSRKLFDSDWDASAYRDALCAKYVDVSADYFTIIAPMGVTR